MSQPIHELAQSSLFSLDSETIVSTESFAPQGSPDLIGAIIDGKYRIISVIGAGGMGCVYLAHHQLLDKCVALKTFRTTTISKEALLRFQREAQAIARLDSEHIVQVYDFGYTDQNTPYYTMEHLTGKSLGELLQERKTISTVETLRIFIPVCAALAVAHKKGIIHRDLKPDNIFLVTGVNNQITNVKIVDFGIASLSAISTEGQRLTSKGMVFGSPLYMSPEQSKGMIVTPATDIYSCACAMFHALTGKPLFCGKSIIETLMMHQNNGPPSLAEMCDSETNFSDDLQDLLDLMLTKTPEERDLDATEVMAELQAILNNLGESAGAEFAPKFGATSTQTSITRAMTTSFANSTTRDSALKRKSATKFQLSTELEDTLQKITSGMGITSTAFITVAIILALIGTGAVMYFVLSAQRTNSPQKIITANADTPNEKAIEPTKPDTMRISPIGEVGIEQLFNFKDCIKKSRVNNTFRMSEGTLSDSQLKEIANCKWIDSVRIQFCEFNNSALVELARLPKLRVLDLSFSKLNDDGCEQLTKAKSINSLEVQGTYITTAGLKKLCTLPCLQELTISQMKIDDSTFETITHCPFLDKLTISETSGYKNATLLSINNVSKLYSLNVSRTVINDNVLSRLILPKINDIDVSSTSITARGLRVFCQHSPKLTVVACGKCSGLSDSDKNQLKKEFPKVAFIIPGSRPVIQL